MPVACFSRQRGLQASLGRIMSRGRAALSGDTGSALLQQLHVLHNNSEKSRTGSLFRTLYRTFSAPSVTAPSRGICVPEAEFAARCVDSTGWKGGQKLGSSASSELLFGDKGIDYCKRVRGLLRRESWGSNTGCKSFWISVSGKNRYSGLSEEPRSRGTQLSQSARFSCGAAPDVSFDGVRLEEQVQNTSSSSDQKLLGDRTLKLLSGSCYLPHPDKEETGGEDAHFICVDEQAIGVADGVGGWAIHGIDAGKYARELMSHSVTAIQEEPKGSIDPARVLEKAYSSTNASGSSTACIIALTDKGIHAVNLGDSGFIVVRDGCTIFRSPVQQHDFNFTYQLGSSSDLPSSAQVFTVPVASGDVIVAGTDGLFDNLYNNEVTSVVVHAIRAGLDPQVTAQKIAAFARQRALDKDRQTPFSAAAQDAGFRYYGGKLDDITVVVSYLTASGA